MQVMVNSGKHVDSSMALKTDIRGRVTEKLRRYEEHLTRGEIHLSDENALKNGPQDKRCKQEARMQGRDPLTASFPATRPLPAVEGATHQRTTSMERDRA